MKFWRGKEKAEEAHFDDWEYPFEEEKRDRSVLKKCGIAILLLCMVWGLKNSGTVAGDMVGAQVQRVVTEHADFSHAAQRMQSYLPEEWRGDLLEKVQGVLARPADPLQYMSAPSEGAVIAGFGIQTDAKTKKQILQEGIEYQSDLGNSVKAASLGTVKKIATDAKLGRFLILAHGQDMETIYGYLAETLVQEGERISQGQVIAKSGKRPSDQEPSLYFEVREKEIPVNPAAKLRGVFPSKSGES